MAKLGTACLYQQIAESLGARVAAETLRKNKHCHDAYGSDGSYLGWEPSFAPFDSSGMKACIGHHRAWSVYCAMH